MRHVIVILFILAHPVTLFAENVFDSDLKNNHELEHFIESISLNQQTIEAVQISISAINDKITDLDYLLYDQQNQINSLFESSEKIETTVQKKFSLLSESLSSTRNELNLFKDHIEVFLETLVASINKIEQRVTQNYLEQASSINELRDMVVVSRMELKQEIENVDISLTKNEARVESLGQDVVNKARHFSYLIFMAVFIGIIGVVLGILIHRKHANSKHLLEENITNVRQRVEEEYVTLDTKLVDLLQNQMNLAEVVSASQPKDSGPVISETDHSLPLRVGEEIFRMRQRLDSLPHDTKGLKPLLKSLERLEDEFTKKGYEVVDMINQHFSDGLNVKARFIPSEDLGPGQRIITKIIKPQINFNDVLIQVAEVEVSTGGK